MDYAKTIGATGAGATILASTGVSYWLFTAVSLFVIVTSALLIRRFWPAN